MTRELKIRSIIYGAGVAVYLCAILVTMNYTLPDMARFVWFLISYLLIGFDAFRKLEENFCQKKLCWSCCCLNWE